MKDFVKIMKKTCVAIFFSAYLSTAVYTIITIMKAPVQYYTVTIPAKGWIPETCVYALVIVALLFVLVYLIDRGWCDD